MNFNSFFPKEFVIDGIAVEDSSVSIKLRCGKNHLSVQSVELGQKEFTVNILEYYGT
jgi:hypothetical protein